MSIEFIHQFFPLTAYLLRSRYATLWERIFPDELQQKCSKPVFLLPFGTEQRDAFPIWWPTLLPLTLLGVAIGLYGHSQLSALAKHRFRPPATSWTLAMAFYAMMNIAAVGCHCLVPRGNPWQPPLVAMDVAATACCAFSAMYGAITDELSSGAGSGGGPVGAKRITSGDAGARSVGAVEPVRLVQDVSAARRAAAGKGRGRKEMLKDLLLGNGLINIFAFFGARIPFMYELLYIGTAVVSAVVIGRYVMRRPKVGRQGTWVQMLFAGAALAVSGAPLDRHLCRLIGPHVNHVTFLFAGCHVIMAALFLYVREELLAYVQPPATATATASVDVTVRANGGARAMGLTGGGGLRKRGK